MGYERQHFRKGQKLKTEHLNHIEEGLETLSRKKAIVDELVTPQLYGAFADGKTDDTAAIQKALDENSAVYFPMGVYMIDQNIGISLRSNQKVILDDAAVITCMPDVAFPTFALHNLVRIDNVENVVISGGSIVGDRSTRALDGKYNNSNCIGVAGSKNVLIEDMDISEARWDSIGVGQYYDSEQKQRFSSEDVTVRNCKLHHDGRSAMSITGCIRFICADCVTHDLQGEIGQVGSAIDLEPDYEETPCTDCVIDNLQAFNNRQGIIINQLCYNTTVIGCRVNTIQNYLTRGDSLIQNCIVDTITCKGAGTPTIDSCVIGKLLITRSATDIVVTNTVIKPAEEYSSVAILYEGLSSEGFENIDDFYAARDNSSTRLFVSNCTIFSKKSGETSTGGRGREGIMWAENTSLLETMFHNCVFFVRNCIINKWYSECTSFINCTFNIDSAGEDLDSSILFYFKGRVGAVNMENFLFTGNKVNICNSILNNPPMAVSTHNAEIIGNTATVDTNKASLGENGTVMVMSLSGISENGSCNIINNVATAFQYFCNPPTAAARVEGNILKL